MDDDIRRAIGSLYFQNVRGARAIVGELDLVPEFRGRVPSERTLFRLFNEVKEWYTPEQQALDQP